MNFVYHINRKWKDDRIDNLKLINIEAIDIEVKHPYDPVRYYGRKYWDKRSRKYIVHLYLKDEYRGDNNLKKRIPVSIHKYIAETELENRFLDDNEKVIYIDGNKTNYHVDNLKVIKKGKRSGLLGPVPFQDYRPSFVNYPDDIHKRSRVNLYHKNDRNKNTGMHLARYLVCVDRSEWLPEHLHVHHIDNDIKNDTLDNLEVISMDEHRKITDIETIEKTPRVKILCDGCKHSFEKLLCDVRNNLNNEKTKSNNIILFMAM